MPADGSGFLFAPRDRLERTAAELSAISGWWALLALAPVLLTALVITAGYVAAGGQDPGFPPHVPSLVYALANVVVLAALARALRPRVWRATTLLDSPSRLEIAGGLLATLGGVLVGWPLTTLLADVLGVGRYAIPDLGTTAGIGAVFLGSVVVAPVAEEILFRGLFLGIALDRGYGPWVAGGSSLVLFAVMHVFTAGMGGVLNALLLGALLTWLRLRFDSLVGAWLMHLLNNALEFAVALSMVPSLYAI